MRRPDAQRAQRDRSSVPRDGFTLLEGSVPRDGFTLLEVLAAVAILAIAFTTLATTAILGLRAEGESRRRMEAAAVADDVLSDIEMQMAGGSVPPVESDETERDGFLVRTEVAPFDPSFVQALTAPEPGAPPPRVRPELAALLPADASSEPPLRTITVEVSWEEGAGERSVLRTTYALDLAAIAPLLEGLDTGAATGALGEGGLPDPALIQQLLEQGGTGGPGLVAPGGGLIGPDGAPQ